MNADTLSSVVRRATGASEAVRGEVIQSLWSGYGEIVRFSLTGTTVPSTILKHVHFPSDVNHPRGWHNDRSHRRKVHSYEVEMAWYRDWSRRCGDACRVPYCHSAETIGEEHLIVLEDLDAAGFPIRKTRLDRDRATRCLAWLANLHATFLGESPTGLWPVGSYWHLATRPDEWEVIEDTSIRQTAASIDTALNACHHRTIIHGDAKVANFCFSEDGERVAAVDFQYVGGGCGMKDVAYFLGSCLDASEQTRWEPELLDLYFAELRRALTEWDKGSMCETVETEWRALFPVAQADFYRFLVGWMPDHWKIHDHSRRVAMEVIARFNA
ncbi:MAG TPA: phosphotransferase [Mariprofundaceae bacterium]|nr:phosphotransferase [Mariprofundaceae bacterium]